MTTQHCLSRRMFLGGGIGATGLASGILALSAAQQEALASSPDMASIMPEMADMASSSNLTPSMVGLPFQNGDVDPHLNGFDPAAMLTTFDTGTIGTLPSGQTVRDYTITATNKDWWLAPAVKFPAFVYNGRLPGPYLRATQGDRIRVTLNNNSDVPHSINFGGFPVVSTTSQGKKQDATLLLVPRGGQAIYEFDVPQFGIYSYQALATPMALVAYRGLFGMLIVDPPQPRSPAYELAMTMTAIPLQVSPGDNPDNDLYTVNGVAFQFMKHPIPIKMNQLVRVYLLNATEFDRINSFHLHANLFNLYRGGTSLTPDELTDTVVLCHGQTAILEFTYKFPGMYMFHAHQAEFSDKGWTSSFIVT